jgi:hypothetical protein
MPKYDLPQEEVILIMKAIDIAVRNGGIAVAQKFIPIADKLGAPFDKKKEISKEKKEI